MQIISWRWELNENPALASWKRRELGISSLKRRVNNGLIKEGVKKKMQTRVLSVLLNTLIRKQFRLGARIY